MNEDFFRMVELSQKEFYCSQILLMLGLEAQEKINPDLVRAMNGLIGGLCFQGHNCGALTGGACLLALYAGKGTPEEVGDSRLEKMVGELVEWFEQEYESKYGGINCSDILENDLNKRKERCPQIVYDTFAKTKELLADNGYDLTGKLEV
ncbi:MAG: C_GCAxxG_C_C family protein [Syntrophomonadaceae bacterium]|nr:C_GCAxxG_C_C family protein [Syntrophomonadaceae bacterium]